MENIAVSVCCITYNQERYIKDTLEGFVSQRFNRPFEVLIHDDASTDGTQSIIKEYAEKYPQIIKPILQTENQRAKGIGVQKTYNYPRVKGKYVAFCEGDDCWTDPLKLQRQYDAMEKNCECSLCVHKTRHITESGTMLKGWFPGIDIQEGAITAKQYIHLELGEKRWLFQTSSYFVKNDVVQDFIKFEHKYPCGDLPLVLFALQYGSCWYIPIEMSNYRKNTGGIMTKNRNSIEANIKFTRRMIEGHRHFDEFTKKKFTQDFEFAIKFAEVQILKCEGRFRNVLSAYYQDVYKALNWKNKLLILLGAAMPKTAYKIFLYIRRKNIYG